MSRRVKPISEYVQRRIMERISKGMTARQISFDMDLADNTIETYLRLMRVEHGAKNSPHLVHIFHTKKLL